MGTRAGVRIGRGVPHVDFARPLVYMSVARGASLDSRAFQNKWTEMGGTNTVLKAGNEMGAMNSTASSNTAVEATILDQTYDPDRFKNQQIAVIPKPRQPYLY
jgi:allophanate hydrolase subunit 2